MFAVMGITGQVGGATARALLADKFAVRAVVRDPLRTSAWVAQGADIAVADMNDEDALVAAFANVDGVFAMIPPNFAPTSDFAESRGIIDALRGALVRAAPPKVVCLSSIGAQHDSGLGLITQLHMLENALGSLPLPVTFLRPAWFMENIAWDIAPARTTGLLHSYLHPLDRAIPMVSTADIGHVAARRLRQRWSGRKVVEIEGPARYSPADLASILAQALHRPVKPVAVPPQTWEETFRQQGTIDPSPRIDMLNGFNNGWIDFEGAPGEHLAGETTMEEAIAALLPR
jgi:NAD(P)H dehydrogenase (quinone)